MYESGSRTNCWLEISIETGSGTAESDSPLGLSDSMVLPPRSDNVSCTAHSLPKVPPTVISELLASKFFAVRDSAGTVIFTPDRKRTSPLAEMITL